LKNETPKGAPPNSEACPTGPTKKKTNKVKNPTRKTDVLGTQIRIRNFRPGHPPIEGARKNGDGLAISDITLLELATLANKGRIRLGISLESFLQEVPTRKNRRVARPNSFQDLGPGHPSPVKDAPPASWPLG